MIFAYNLSYLLAETISIDGIAGPQEDGRNQPLPSSGMADVMAKILARQVDSSKSAILAKCKTNRELSRKKRDSASSKDVDFRAAKELQTAKVKNDLSLKVSTNSL